MSIVYNCCDFLNFICSFVKKRNLNVIYPSCQNIFLFFKIATCTVQTKINFILFSSSWSKCFLVNKMQRKKNGNSYLQQIQRFIFKKNTKCRNLVCVSQNQNVKLYFYPFFCAVFRFTQFIAYTQDAIWKNIY